MSRPSFQYAPSLILAGVVLLGVFVALQLVVAVYELVLVVFLGIVLGIALSPLASFLTRYRIPRALSVIGVYLVVAAILAGFVWYTVPRMGTELEAMSVRIETLQEDYERLANDSPLPPLEEAYPAIQARLQDVAPALVSQAFLAVTLLLYLFTILVVAVFYSTTEKPAKRLILSLVAPQHRRRTEEVMAITAKKLRRYIVGDLISMTVIGSLTYVGLLIIGIPFPFVLAVIAFLFEALPIVGPWISFVPALAVAATEGWEAMLLVTAFYIILQQIESNIVTPVVQNRQTELPSLVILVSILVGGALMGLLGALAALPVAIVVQTLFMEVFVPWRRRRIGTVDEVPGEPATASLSGGTPVIAAPFEAPARPRQRGRRAPGPEH